MRIINEGKSFYIMFDALDGGMLETLELSPANLQNDKSIILLDEENQTVWLWHGKLRGLVSRRTALRQAQSLKGHGFQTGNAIVGRDLHKIREIDDRKVGRVPEDTKASEEFRALLNGSFVNIGNDVYTMNSGGAVSQAKPSKPVPKAPKLPETKPEAKTELPPEEIPSSEPIPEVPKKKEELQSDVARKYKLKHVEPESKLPKIKSLPTTEPKKEPAVPEASSADMKWSVEDKSTAAVIMSVLSQFSDIWISKKENGTITIEQMDGKICSFMVVDGEIRYQQGSYNGIDSSKKDEIMHRIQDFL